jgi:hypothetical protein
MGEETVGLGRWVDKPAIREVVKRSMGYVDDPPPPVQGHHWFITNRTGVSVARPGEAPTDAERARALERMPVATRAVFRTE